MVGQSSRATPGQADLQRLDPRLPLHVKLRDLLVERVRSGEWTPEQPLPAETALAESYGVALGTMRRVLGTLVEEGLLERRQGSGTFVRRARFDSSLFRFFRYGRPGDEPPVSRILSFDRAGADPRAAEPLGVSPGTDALHLNRVRLRDDHPLLVEDIWLPRSLFSGLADMDPERFGDLLYPSYEQHCGIVIASADEVLTVEPATAADALLLRCARREPLVVIERTARTHDGTAVEWRRSRGRATEFRYRVEIR